MNRAASAVVACILSSAVCAAEFDLSGQWTLTQADKPSVTCPVSVPGGTYTALYDAKLIPDPYFAQNEKLTQWPGRVDWLFARSFTLPEGFAAPKWGDPSTIEVWAVNDRDAAFEGTASLDLWTLAGTCKPFAAPAVRIAPRSVAKVGEWPLASFSGGRASPPSDTFLRMRLDGRAGSVAESVSNEWMFDLFMNMDLAKTDIKTTFAEKDGKFLVTLFADKPAFFVWANVWRTRGEFDDNSITLYPGEPRTLTFTPKAPGLKLDAFRRSFSVTHLRETYR